MSVADTKALVVLSGGQDSTTCLYWAIDRFGRDRVESLTFDYGQRHHAELAAAKRVAAALDAVEHKILPLSLDAIGGSALTDRAIDVPEAGGEGIPVTYVPARNTVLLALLLGLAEVVEADQLFIGANAVDYSGYPDCRPAFLAAFEQLAHVATVAGTEHGVRFRVRAPLLHLTKAEIIRRGLELGVDYSGARLALQANLYAMEFRDEIALTGELSDIGLPLRRNVDSSFRRGLELDLRWLDATLCVPEAQASCLPEGEERPLAILPLGRFGDGRALLAEGKVLAGAAPPSGSVLNLAPRREGGPALPSLDASPSGAAVRDRPLRRVCRARTGTSISVIQRV